MHARRERGWAGAEHAAGLPGSRSSCRHRAHRPRGAGSSPQRAERCGGQGPGAPSLPRPGSGRASIRAPAAAETRAGSFPAAPAGIYSFPGAGSGSRFFIFVSFPPRRSPTSPRRPCGAGSWGCPRLARPGSGSALPAPGRAAPLGAVPQHRAGIGREIAFPGPRSPRRSPETGSLPPPPPPSPPMGPPNLSWLGSGSGRSKSPALGSAPGDRRPRRPLDPNRWGAAKGRPRRASATRPRRDPHPVVPAGTLGGWKGRQPRATRREGRSPGHSPWKSESLGTSIPARIQCSSGKEPATAAFRCSAPGGGRWGTPV